MEERKFLQEIQGDAWEYHKNGAVLCITTNGTLTEHNSIVTGAGIAQEATERYRMFPYDVGRLVRHSGNHCYYLPHHLVNFVVKHNWFEKADLQLIQRSMAELIGLMGIYDWKEVILPRPGCGNGKLSWEKEVKPALFKICADYVYGESNVGAAVRWKFIQRIKIITNLSVEKEFGRV